MEFEQIYNMVVRKKMKRECKHCGKTKSIIEFDKNKLSFGGRLFKCKNCVNSYNKKYYLEHKEAHNKHYAKYRKETGYDKFYYIKNKKLIKLKVRAYYRTIDGYANQLYNNIKSRIKHHPNYEHIKLTFNKKEFLDFLKHSNYKKIFEVWTGYGYTHSSAPSVDKINNGGDYSLNNIQIITAGENARKGNR